MTSSSSSNSDCRAAVDVALRAPRLEIDLNKIEHNTQVLVTQLGARGVTVTGVTKSLLGSPEVAAAMRRGGVVAIADSRVENVERLRVGTEGQSSADVGRDTIALIRSPMMSQLDRVVVSADMSLNSEPRVIAGLGAAARRAGAVHGIMVMVELGDLREGALPADIGGIVRGVLNHPNLVLAGVGTNLACQSGVAPDEQNMGELSRLVQEIEANFGIKISSVSGGNSANLHWALTADDLGRVNHLRIGEAILLGTEPLYRHPIVGLHTDAITLVAEVIEAKCKPARPWGNVATTTFGVAAPRGGQGSVRQLLLALGQQDVDPSGLIATPGVVILGASSDHLVVAVDDTLADEIGVGAELRFGVNYSSLLRAATSPFVGRHLLGGRSA